MNNLQKNKLLEYTQSFVNSQFSESYERYLIELKLTESAIEEAKQNSNKDDLLNFESHKKIVLAKLEKFGIILKS